MAIALTLRITGAFQGAMPTETPAARRTAIAVVPAWPEGMISPAIWVVIAAASSSRLAAKKTLKCPQPAVEPVSAVMLATSSGPRSRRRTAAAVSLARRSVAGAPDQAGKAAAAASTALRASSAEAAAATVTTSPPTGLRRSKVAPRGGRPILAGDDQLGLQHQTGPSGGGAD